jgi:Protein of unknown function (DUF3987)
MIDGIGDDLGSFFTPEELRQHQQRQQEQRQQEQKQEQPAEDSEDSEDEPRKGNGKTQWAEPEPLVAPREAERPYPTDALPPIIRHAIEEYSKYGQQPLPLIATSALSCVSLATQGLADVARDAYLIGPISLYFLVIAVSGERQTSADNWFKKPIVSWVVDARDGKQDEVSEACAAMAAWQARRDGLINKIKSASGRPACRTEDRVDIAQLQKDLAELEKNKPTPVIVPRLFYEDTNSPTLASDFASDWPSASLWSDEAGLVVGAQGMSDDMAMGFFGLLNRLWDGKPFDRDRSSARRAYMRGRRFTSSLMAQPIVMERLLSLAGGASRGMGLLSRFFVTWPTSTIGAREYENVDRMEAIGALAARLRALLEMDLPLDPAAPTIMALQPPVLQLTPRAHRLWKQFHNDVETELGIDGEYADVADIGAKIAENAARLAANFHVMANGPGGAINSKTMWRAIKVASWHLYEARRVLAAFDKSQTIADAQALLEWLPRRLVKDAKADLLDPRQVLQFGPKALREVKRRDAAIKLLVDHGYLIPLSGRPRRFQVNLGSGTHE